MKELNGTTPIVILSDGDTWDTMAGTTVALLTWEGEGHVMDGGSIDTLEPEYIVTEIDLKELVRCWLEHNKIDSDIAD
jgi:hypothetical protein